MRIEQWVILPDLHIPFQNKKLLLKIYKLIHQIKPYGIILSGDYLDMFSLSVFSENSLKLLKEINLSYEYSQGNLELKKIEDVLPKGIKKHYLYGNHEDRYLRWLERGDHAKLDEVLRSPEEAMQLHKKGWKVYTKWRDDAVFLGNHLEVIHGCYTPDNASKKHLSEFNGSVIFGHTHRFGSYVDGKRSAYNIGFLGDKNSEGFNYMNRAKRQKQVNGFAVVSIDTNGEYWVNAIQCWNDKFIYNHKLF